MAEANWSKANKLAKDLEWCANMMTEFLEDRDWTSPWGSEAKLKETRKQLKAAAKLMRDKPSENAYQKALRFYKNVVGLM